VSLGNRQNFILYQNDRNSWSYVAGPGQIGDGVALISVSGSPRNNVVGSAIDGSGVYWFKYPGSRNGVWASHYIGSANAGVSIGSGILPNGQDYIVVASAEDAPVAWPGGLAFFTQNSDPSQPWNATTRRTGEPAPGAGTIEAREVLESAFRDLPGALKHPGLLHPMYT
jgi:hypothetical protein